MGVHSAECGEDQGWGKPLKTKALEVESSTQKVYYILGPLLGAL